MAALKNRLCKILIFILLVPNLVFAQNETNIWYFGNFAGLDFNDGEPTPLLDGALDTFEGCSTIADTNGNLLFYTDGSTVYNRNHSIMQNGTGLNGNESSTHSALIVPKPEHPNLYYIFTVDFEAGSNGLQFSEVDMSLNEGLGGVNSNKNILLHSPTTEKLTAIKSSNDGEYWVISHKWESDEFIAYNVSNSGINTTPVISVAGSYVGGSIISASIGQIKVSPNGLKLAVARDEGLSEVQLFDFDAASGVVSNSQMILNFFPNNRKVYGIEFSPDSNLLYVSVIGVGVFQYNLQAGNLQEIISSEVKLTTLQKPYAAMQLASDGKIYIAKTNQFYIDVIDNPNIIGVGCNYQYEHLYLGGRRSRSGLPPFIQSFFQIGFTAQNVCFGNTTQFTSNISQAYDSLIWDFGDGTTSSLENPNHEFTASGIYQVQLTVTSGGETSNESKQITIYEPPTLNPAVDLFQCDVNNDGFGLFSLSEAFEMISTNYLNENISFFESQINAMDNVDAISNSEAYTNQTAGYDLVYARVENNQGCFAVSEVGLNVPTSQIPTSFLKTFYQCDDGIDGYDGIATFDFSSVSADIQALFPSVSNLYISYYPNENDALVETNEITNPTNYENTGSPNQQGIYVKVTDGNTGACLGFKNVVRLIVDPKPWLTGPVIIEQCDANNDGEEIFDTSGIEALLLQGQTGP